MDFTRRKPAGGIGSEPAPPVVPASELIIDQEPGQVYGPLQAEAKPIAKPGHASPGLARPDQQSAAPEAHPLTSATLGGTINLANRAKHLFRLYWWLIIGALVFFILADVTAFMNGELRPGQVVFSNSMTQLWTGLFRSTLIIGGSLMLLRLLQGELFEYFRPDRASGPDMIDDFMHHITPFQRICVFWFVYFLLCLVLVLIQLVNLPPNISVGR